MNRSERKLNIGSKEGFSLIELIIAIAILAIFVGVISLSLGLLRSADTKGLGSHINDSLTDLKAITQAHTGPYYLHLYKKDGAYWKYYDNNDTFSVDTITNVSENRLCSDSMAVKIVGGPNNGDLLGEAGITVSIKKKDGSYNSGIPVALEVYKSSDGSGTPDYRVILAEKTGLHYLEQL